MVINQLQVASGEVYKCREKLFSENKSDGGDEFYNN